MERTGAGTLVNTSRYLYEKWNSETLVVCLLFKLDQDRVDTKFRNKNYFRNSRNFGEISTPTCAKFREIKQKR
jgi:hypothetical protein